MHGTVRGILLAAMSTLYGAGGGEGSAVVASKDWSGYHKFKPLAFWVYTSNGFMGLYATGTLTSHLYGRALVHSVYHLLKLTSNRVE